MAETVPMIDLIRNLIVSETTSIKQNLYQSRANVDASIFSVLYIWAQLRSKDPNTKVGAAIYEPKIGALHLGYNGFNHDVPDDREIWENRNMDDPMSKYRFIVHAEVNAIMKALRAGFRPEEAVLYCTHFPCHRCIKDVVIPSGIKKIKYLDDYPPDATTHEILRHTDIEMTKIMVDLSY